MIKQQLVPALFLLLILKTTTLFAQNKTIAGEFITEPPTLICLGFEWYIKGDDNRNAEVKVEYRQVGTSEWKNNIPLLRIGNEQCGEPLWNYKTENMFAGSIMDLKPDTEYECKLTITDNDGVEGENSKLVTIKTRKEPRANPNGNIRHVYPKDWKGEKQQPAYNGLLHAYYGYPRYADWILTTEPVKAGDIILVHGGEYKADYKNYRDYHGLTFDGTYFLTQKGTDGNPITIKAAGDGEVFFDGNGCAVLFDLTAADFHYIEGITIQNTEVAIRAGLMNAYGCNGLTIKNCLFKNIGIGVQGQFEGSKYFYIADNTFIGREDIDIVYHSKLEDGRRIQRLASYYAVKVHGQGHTVCYNSVSYFFDGIDICTHSKPETDPAKKAVAIDFYNNDFFLCNDNFIEADGGNHNIRILRNRGFNSGQQALSNQPVLGGPVYWIRNVVYNCGNASTFKFWGMYPSGMLMYHNTSSGIFTRDDKPGSNVHSRNNLFLPSDDADLPTLGLYTYTNYSSLDYNGYRKRQPFIGYSAPGKDTMYDFHDNRTIHHYASLKNFSKETNQEEYGMEVKYDIFTNAKAPKFKAFNLANEKLGNSYPIYHPKDFDFTLKADAIVIDKGIVLPTINDNYTGDAPDLGAYEYGLPIPHYGPRPLPNSLTEQEKEDGWVLLFDGVSTTGWTGFNLDSITPNWTVKDGSLHADGSRGDIVSDMQFKNFELSLEWKISEGGNSGIFYHVKEGEEYNQIWRTGIEMQVMDNLNNSMAKDPINGAGSLYGMYPPNKKVNTTYGKWYKSRIVVNNNHAEYWLDGEKLNEYELWTKKWYDDREKCLHNKNRKPRWGEYKTGRIAVQDEGFEVQFRDIKIRKL